MVVVATRTMLTRAVWGYAWTGAAPATLPPEKKQGRGTEWRGPCLSSNLDVEGILVTANGREDDDGKNCDGGGGW